MYAAAGGSGGKCGWGVPGKLTGLPPPIPRLEKYAAAAAAAAAATVDSRANAWGPWRSAGNPTAPLLTGCPMKKPSVKEFGQEGSGIGVCGRTGSII